MTGSGEIWHYPLFSTLGWGLFQEEKAAILEVARSLAHGTHLSSPLGLPYGDQGLWGKTLLRDKDVGRIRILFRPGTTKMRVVAKARGRLP